MASRAQQSKASSELLALRYRIRHSASHIMADAVLELFPETKFAIGPPTDDGFYYDFEVSRPFTPEDLHKIEQVMLSRIAAETEFFRTEITHDSACDQFQNQPYKLELIESIPSSEPISTFSHGAFTDLCEGPHVQNTSEIAAIRLLSIAGAYWRGNENNVMLQRIYGTAFENQEALDDYLTLLDEAERRDHRKLGRQLDLYSIHEDVGPGLVIWHPKGAQIRSIIEDLWRKEHQSRGYQLIYSPHIGRSRLWETSGHLDFYSESMYPPIDMEGQLYYAKPMNCPFHIMYYKSGLRSYRELPIRTAELGTVYRNERGGVLHGLLRVRGFTQDDAHIFCRPEQVEQEILDVLELTFYLLKLFEFDHYAIYLSTQPEKSVGDPSEWDLAQNALREALTTFGLAYEIDSGGGAFYGPKIDIKVYDALGREWQCTTIQFDFNLPERFGLTFVGEDGQEHRPFMIHRAILGSLERFLGILIEHYAGAFPVWLAPIQVIVIPIADRHLEYAINVCSQLTIQGIRTEVSKQGKRMQAKIREAEISKIPYILVVGDREIEESKVSLRLRDGTNLESLSPLEVTRQIQNQIGNQKDQ